MHQAMFHRCAFAQECVYEFHCRSDEDLTPYIPALREELQHLCTLRYTQHELTHFKSKPWFKPDYVQFLKHFQLDYTTLSIHSETVDEQHVLRLSAKGSAVDETMFEIHVMSILSEIRNRTLYPDVTFEDVRKKLFDKIAYLKSAQKEHGLENFFFADFGTRRRLSFETQRTVNTQLARKLPEMFIGTSNFHLANELGITPIGTQAHEWFQLFQQSHYQLGDSIAGALEEWVQEYRGNLGIALTDIVTMDAFTESFDLFFAKIYDGLRHDSGCPFTWGEKAIDMYEKLGVDPSTKTLVFSDGLNMELCVKLWLRFHKYIKISFGVGTHLTNDVDGVTPLNMVMKLLSVNGKPTAKISDSPGKTLCKDQAFIAYLRSVYHVK